MIDKSLEQIEPADIQRLVDNRVQEGRAIDYKEKLPSGTDEEKKEFLADVSSFANAVGGDLVIGVSELREGNKPTGFPFAAEGVDTSTGAINLPRLENILRDGIAPRLQGVKFREITGFARGPVLVIRIPRSWNRPHMITYQQWCRFYSRNSQGKYLLDVSEIRQAFVAGATAAQQARLFIRERIASIEAGDIDTALDENHAIVVHVVPLSAFERTEPVDLRRLSDSRIVAPLYATGHSRRFNVDGFATFDSSAGDKDRHYAYLQAFRNGAIEGGTTGTFTEPARDRVGATAIASRTLAEAFVDFVGRALKILSLLDVEPPAVVHLALVGVRGCVLGVGGSGWHRVRPFTRDVLMLPDTIVEDFTADPTGIARPILDALWQAAGFDECAEYDEKGAWLARR